MRLSPSLAAALIPILATAEASAFWFGRSAHNSPAQRRQPHPAHLVPQERAVVTVDERGLPVTITTTLWEVVTQTQTIWVDPTTAQHPFEPSAISHSASASESVDAESAAATPSATSRPAHASGHASVSEMESRQSASRTASVPASETSLAVNSGSASATTHMSASATTDWSSETASVSDEAVSSSSRHVAHPSSVETASLSTTETATASIPSASVTDMAVSSSASWAEESSSAVSFSRPASASGSSSIMEPTSSVSDTASVTDNISASAASALASATASASATSPASASESEAASATESISPTSSSIDAASASPSPSSASTPLPSPSSNSGALQPIPRTLMAGYYPDWSAWYLTPEQVDWSRFDIMDFAFAIPTAQGGLEFTQWDSSDLLHRLVNTAHAAGKRVKLSIGGWTGSQYFSTIAADDGLRATFVKSMVDAYWTYKLDGIDIDWEYPNAQGAYGNAISSSDSANFLLLLQQLRAALPDGAIITLATQVWPFAGPNGSPLSDVSGFAAVIDWILIMNYDIWGSSSDPGPNAPLSDACGTSTQPLANAYAAVSSWTQAGMPADQITLGVPAYGYLSASWNDNLRTRDLPAQNVPGSGFPLEAPITGQDGQIGLKQRQRSRRALEKRYVTVNSGWSTSEGQVMWHDLVSQGALAKGRDGKWIGAGGFERKWDQCSSTPFLKSTSSGQIISYDDPDSMSLKAQFAKQAGLRGCNVFSVDGDYTAGAWPLTDAVRSGLGLW